MRYCKNCRKEIYDNFNFCNECGFEIKDNPNTETIEKEIPEKNSTSKWESFFNIFIFLIIISVARTSGMIFFALVIPALLGTWFAKWYAKKDKTTYPLMRWIGWSNTLSWILPILGMFTSLSTLNFKRYFVFENKKFKILGIIGLILSVINAIASIYMLDSNK